MHYYQFNIGDYMSHTKGLTLLEDLAYRRMLDEYYLHESPLPLSISEIARQIGLPEKKEEVAYVLSKFFVETEKGYINARAQKEIKKYKANQRKKSEAGKLSGKARRNKSIGVEQTLNTCSTNDELNINHKPITNNHKPLTIVKDKTSQRFTPPTLSEVMAYCNERGNHVDPQRFINHYSANGWMRGKNKIKDWKACVRTWEQNDNQTATVKPLETYESTVARLTDRSWAG